MSDSRPTEKGKSITEVWVIDDCHIPQGMGKPGREGPTEAHLQSQVAKSIKHPQSDHDVSAPITVARALRQVLRRSQQGVPSVTLNQVTALPIIDNLSITA